MTRIIQDAAATLIIALASGIVMFYLATLLGGL